MKIKNKIILKQICIIIAICILVTNNIIVLADSVKVITLGADLTTEQKELMLNYFNVTEQNVHVITVTNTDEHKLLDGIATQQQIGKHTYSCTYIEPTDQGGIHVKTVNLNWVTCDMIRNALVTSGITNCNVVAAAPIEVSGTGSLTGIFMAYEKVTNTNLDTEKKEIASEELVTTLDIAENIGQSEASQLISDLKLEVISKELTSIEDIANLVNKYIKENKIELSDKQLEALINILNKISKQDYNLEEMKKAYEDVKNTINKVQKTAEEARNIFEKISHWLKVIWSKITGTYEKLKESETTQYVQEQLGILMQTDESLLGESAVITDTETETNTKTNTETEVIKEDNNENKEDKEDKKWYNFILDLFNTDEEINNVETTAQSNSEEQINEDMQSDIKEEVTQDNESKSMLDYVIYDTEENVNENSVPTLDDITKN